MRRGEAEARRGAYGPVVLLDEQFLFSRPERRLGDLHEMLMSGLYLSVVSKTKSKVITLTTRDANKGMNQSELETNNACKCRQARENANEQVMSDSSFTSD